MRRLAPLVHLALAVLATWPLAASPFTRLIGHEDVDVWNHAWGSFWFWDNLVDGRLPWRTDLLFAPRGGVLWYIDPIGGVAGLPLFPLMGAVGAYNLVILALFALASAAGRRVALALGATEAGSWIAAVAFSTTPYLLCETQNGISEAVGVAWTGYALAAALTAQTPRAWAGVGLWLALTTLGTWYYGLAASVTVGGIAILRRQWAGVTVTPAVTAALVFPLFVVVGRSVHAEDALVSRGAIAAWDWDRLLSHNAVDPQALWTPGGFQSVDLAARGEAFLHSSYLGLVALGLALLARARRHLLAALPAVALSLGVYLWWNGAWVEWKPNGRWLLPFGMLAELLPEAGSTHAQRMIVPALALVAGLAGAGASRLPRQWLPVLGVLVLADNLRSAPWPLPRAPVLDTAAHAALRGKEGIVVDLPGEVAMSMATSRFLVYQTVSGRPIPYRPDARANTASYLGRGWFTRLRMPSQTNLQLRTAMGEEVARHPENVVEAIRKAGVRAFVLHPELDRGTGAVAELRGILEAWFGPGTTIGTHEVWELP